MDAVGDEWQVSDLIEIEVADRARGDVVGVAVDRGLDPAVGALEMRDAELVDLAVEGIGDAAHMPPDANGS